MVKDVLPVELDLHALRESSRRRLAEVRSAVRVTHQHKRLARLLQRQVRIGNACDESRPQISQGAVSKLNPELRDRSVGLQRRQPREPLATKLVGELRVQRPAGTLLLECPPDHEPLVVPSEHHLRSDHRQVKALRRLLAAGPEVTETPDRLDPSARELRAQSPQSPRVRVNIREHGDSHPSQR